MPKHIAVIINPAAGNEEPILKPLNTIFRQAGHRWSASITQEKGDGRRMAQEAAANGADIVAAYGGDGTVTEVASGLIGTDVPLAILPGGTANLLAQSLGISQNLSRSAGLILNTASRLRPLDVGKIVDSSQNGEKFFLIQASIGLVATMIAGADREAKDRMGLLAYMLSGIKALQAPPVAHYELTLDDRKIKAEGITCVVVNSGYFGVPGLTLAPNISTSDGLLDVMVVRRTDLGSLVSLVSSIAGLSQEATKQALSQWFASKDAFNHWQARRIRIEASPSQEVQADGELLQPTPADVEVIPQGVQVIVPRG